MARVQFLDCLRALAIGLVVMVHYNRLGFQGGAIGVAIFFALSGYLITGMLLDEERMDWATIWRFLVRRFLRVYPPYLVSIALILMLSYLLDRPGFEAVLGVLPRLLTFDTGFPGMGVAIGVFWTLQIEFSFYLLMPLLMLILGRGQVFTGGLIVLMLLALWLRADPQTLALLPERLRPLQWFDTLVLGALAAVAVRSRPAAWPTALPGYALLWKFLLGVLLAMAVFVSNDDPRVWYVTAMLAALLTAVWIYLQHQSGSDVNLPAVAWLGRISYSLYLLHAIPLHFRSAIPPDWFRYGAIFALLFIGVAAAALMHGTVERPAIRLGRWITARRPKSLEAIQ